MPQVPYEEQARNLLDHLYHYQRRQSHYQEDLQFVTVLLQEWDAQVRSLMWRVTQTDRRVHEMHRYATSLERKLALRSFTAFWHYLLFLVGRRATPSPVI